MNRVLGEGNPVKCKMQETSKPFRHWRISTECSSNPKAIRSPELTERCKSGEEGAVGTYQMKRRPWPAILHCIVPCCYVYRGMQVPCYYVYHCMQVPLYQPWYQATIVPFIIVPQLYQPSYQMTIVHKSNYPGARIFCHYCTYPIISAQFPYGESSRQTNLLVARCGPGGAGGRAT